MVSVGTNITRHYSQLEVSKPLVNLLDNMVRMGSLYGGNNLMLASQYKQVSSRQTHTDAQTHTDTDTQTQTHRHTHTHTLRHGHTHTHTHTHTDTQTEREGEFQIQFCP